jgi:hypothetical protein
MKDGVVGSGFDVPLVLAVFGITMWPVIKNFLEKKAVAPGDGVEDGRRGVVTVSSSIAPFQLKMSSHMYIKVLNIRVFLMIVRYVSVVLSPVQHALPAIPPVFQALLEVIYFGRSDLGVFLVLFLHFLLFFFSGLTFCLYLPPMLPAVPFVDPYWHTSSPLYVAQPTCVASFQITCV